ncbi:hypothetical protein CPHO_03950 [Corynebacterium phocae]|uniref:ribonuclease H n=1 Tax=Corynebacterium phocae TaxID=161895 RepID=A0A1L7D245_9CORY|nr:hypothetical protein CPHO_03950 [Corynebacterium phocae]
MAEVAALTKAVKSVKLLQPFSVRHGQSQGVAGRACFCQTCRSIPLLVDRQCFVPLKSGRYLDEYLNHVAEVSAQLRVSSLPGVVMVGQQRDPGVAVKGPIGGLLDGVVAQDARKAVGSLNTRFGQQKVDVYTDASCSRSGAVATAAGVSADGNYFAFKVEQPDSGLLTTNYCEAIGVMAAVQTWWGLGRRLIIHTDSQAIVSGVRKYLAGKDLTLHQETQGVVRQIAELTKIYAALGGSIKFKWVPGHAGVHLNEIADRLARAARHTNHPVVGKDAKNTIFANIIADAQSPPPQSKPTVSGQARLMDKISGTAG